MKRIKYNSTISEDNLSLVCTELKRGGILVYPTDTIYGIGCSIYHYRTIQKIYNLKRRDTDYPLSIMCSDVNEVLEYAEVSCVYINILKHALPGPYTFILNSSKKTPLYIQTSKMAIGVRVPDNRFCQAVVKSLGFPIITTSVNYSGDPPINIPDHIENIFGKDIDLLIDAGPLKSSPSTVIDLTDESPVVLRQGIGKVDFIFNILNRL